MKANSNPDIKVFLIGNKLDLEESRLVAKERAIQFKNDFEWCIYEDGFKYHINKYQSTI